MNPMVIRDIMSRPISIAKSATITEALDKMLEEQADPLIVTHNGSVMGTVSRKSVAEILGSRRNASLSPSAIHVATTVEDDFTSAYPDQDVDVVVPLLQRYKLVVVLDHDHRLVGQITAGDLLRVAVPDCLLSDVMDCVCTIQSEERVVHLRRRMLDDDITKFVVMDGDSVVGIVTETDVATAYRSFREVVEGKYQYHRIRNLLVRDIMTRPPLTLDAGVELKQVVDLMLKKNISCVPITDKGSLAGMVTRESLIQAL